MSFHNSVFLSYFLRPTSYVLALGSWLFHPAYADYVRGGAAMNLEGRVAYAPTKRINLWAHTGVGLFGDFAPRYHWTVETGCRYFFLRNTMIKGKSND